jgi:hypothetical protein
LTANESVSMAAFSCNTKWPSRNALWWEIIFRNFD